MSRPSGIIEVAEHIWGTANDAAFWDGWRSHGDDWARRYLREALASGVDLVGPLTRHELMAALEARS